MELNNGNIWHYHDDGICGGAVVGSGLCVLPCVHVCNNELDRKMIEILALICVVGPVIIVHYLGK
jgi:hypothetical protein